MSLGRGCDASGVAGGRKVETSQERGRTRAGGGCRLKHMQQTRENRSSRCQRAAQGALLRREERRVRVAQRPISVFKRGERVRDRRPVIERR